MNASNHLLCSAGGLDLAFDSAHVHCVHESLVAQKENGTHDWFLGLAVADQQLLPVTDLGQFLLAEQSSGRVIEVSRELGIAGLKVDEVHGVSQSKPTTPNSQSFAKTVANKISLGNTQAAHNPAAEPLDKQQEHDSPILDSVITEQGRQYHLVDLEKLVRSQRFLNVMQTPA